MESTNTNPNPAAGAYGSRDQARDAVRRVMLTLTEAGHRRKPEQLITVLNVNPQLRHVVVVATEPGSTLNERVADALRSSAAVTGEKLLETAVEMVREESGLTTRRVWNETDNGRHESLNLKRLMTEAWTDITGERCTDAAALPGMTTLARVLTENARIEGIHIGTALAYWGAGDTDNREAALTVLKRAAEAESAAGQSRREVAGEKVIRREEQLRQACKAVHDQIHAEESAYSSTKLFDSASDLLEEVLKILEAVDTTEHDSANGSADGARA